MADCIGWVLFGGFMCCVWVVVAFHFGYRAGLAAGGGTHG
jgi:hypothetical protein